MVCCSLEPRLPNCTSRGSLRGRAINYPKYISHLALKPPGCNPVPQHPSSTTQDEPLMGPPRRYQTSCGFVPWGRLSGRAGLPQLCVHGLMLSVSMRPCQRWSSIRPAVDAAHPTLFRAELVLPIDVSAVRSASGLTRLQKPFGDRGFSSLTMSPRGRVPTAPTSPAALGGRESIQTRSGHSKSVPGLSLVMPQPLAVLPRPSCRS